MCHHVGPRVTQANQNNISQTCTIYMPLGLSLTQAPPIPPCLERKLRHNYTDLERTGFPNSSGLGEHPVGHLSATSAASHLLLVSTPLLHLTNNIVTPRCTLVVSSGFCFTREMCKTLWKSRDVLHCPSNTDLAVVFFFSFLFLLEKSSWFFYIVMTLMMTMITYLLAVKGALPPACACMKGAMTV